MTLAAAPFSLHDETMQRVHEVSYRATYAGAAQGRTAGLRLTLQNSQFLPKQSRRVLHAMLNPYDRGLLQNDSIPSGRQPMRGIRTKEHRFT